jgi:hypothetical protein
MYARSRDEAGALPARRPAGLGAQILSGASRSSSIVTSLLKKPADTDDCADMVVTMCRTETMTCQTVVIDSGRYFH